MTSRRTAIKLLGLSAGTAGISSSVPTVLAQDPEGFIIFDSQVTDGTSLQVSSVESDIDCTLVVRDEETSRGRTDLGAGTHEDIPVEIEPALTESQILSARLHPAGSGSGFARNEAVAWIEGDDELEGDYVIFENQTIEGTEVDIEQVNTAVDSRLSISSEEKTVGARMLEAGHYENLTIEVEEIVSESQQLVARLSSLATGEGLARMNSYVQIEGDPPPEEGRTTDPQGVVLFENQDSANSSVTVRRVESETKCQLSIRDEETKRGHTILEAGTHEDISVDLYDEILNSQILSARLSSPTGSHFARNEAAVWVDGEKELDGAFVIMENQSSDGTAVNIAQVNADEAVWLDVRDDETSRTSGELKELGSGTHEDVVVELEPPLSESQTLSANLYSAEGGSGLMRMHSYVEVDENAPSLTPEDDSIPGPGIVGTVGSLVGAGYVLKLWSEKQDK